MTACARTSGAAYTGDAANTIQLDSSVNLAAGLVGKTLTVVQENVHRFNLDQSGYSRAIVEAVFNESIDTIGYFDSNDDSQLTTDDTSGLAITASTASDSTLDIIDPASGDVLSGNVTPTSTAETETTVAAGTSVDGGVLTLVVGTANYFSSEDAYQSGVWGARWSWQTAPHSPSTLL